MPMSLRRFSATTACTACLLVADLGCRLPEGLHAAKRRQQGVVFVLPGIEGPSVWNRDIALGLDEGGVTSAIEVYDWTVGLPGGFVFNLADLERNRRQARKLAERIVAYQQRYPSRPVHLIGHSGGAGILVLTLEALPAGRPIDRAILLAPALSPDYDLSAALRRARFGLYSFYSKRDVSFLMFGTSLLGPIDRDPGVSAGAVGFSPPADLNQADRAVYAERLRQVRWSPWMRRVGASGSHVGWTSRAFARDYLAPIIKETEAARPLPPEDMDETPATGLGSSAAPAGRSRLGRVQLPDLADRLLDEREEADGQRTYRLIPVVGRQLRDLLQCP